MANHTTERSPKIPDVFKNHALVQRYYSFPNFINYELTPAGKKSPRTLWTPTSKDEMHLRPHLIAINSHDVSNGVDFFSAWENVKKFNCGIGFIPKGTPVGCIDCDIKSIADLGKRAEVFASHAALCREFDTFAEESDSGGLHSWLELTDKTIFKPYDKFPDQYIELFLDYNFVALNKNQNKRNGKPLNIRQELLIQRFPEIQLNHRSMVSMNGHRVLPFPQPTGGDAVTVDNGAATSAANDGSNVATVATGAKNAATMDETWTIEPTMSDDAVCAAIRADGRFRNQFNALWYEEFDLSDYNGPDQSFCNIVSLFTDSKKQVASIWVYSPLGYRTKAQPPHDKDKTQTRPDYVIRTVNNSFNEKRLQFISSNKASPVAQQTNVPAPLTYTLATLPSVLADDAPVEWIIPGIVFAGGITLLTGDSKSGKSTFKTWECYCVANGISFLDLDVQPARPALYFDYENPKSIIQERFHNLQVTDGPNFKYWGIHLGEVPHPCAPAILKEIEQMFPRPLVVIDSFIGNYDDGDEGNSVQVRQWYKKLDPLKRLGCGIAVIDHIGLDNDKNTRGSSDKKAAVDLAFKLVNAGGSTGLTELTLTCFASRGRSIDQLTFGYENGILVNRDVEQQIERILKTTLWNEMNTGDILDALKPHSKHKVHAVLDKLVANGTVVPRKGDRNTVFYKLYKPPIVENLPNSLGEFLQRAQNKGNTDPQKDK